MTHSYSAGTIAVEEGSATVVGTDVDFTAAGIADGWVLQGPDGRLYPVLAVSDATHLTLTYEYRGEDAAEQPYVLFLTQDYLHGIAREVGQIVQDFVSIQNGDTPGLFPDGTAAEPSISMTTAPDSGFFKAGDNAWGFSAEGELRLTLDPAGATVENAHYFSGKTSTGAPLALLGIDDEDHVVVGARSADVDTVRLLAGQTSIAALTPIGLGVGTDNPQQLLHVAGEGRIDGNLLMVVNHSDDAAPEIHLRSRRSRWITGGAIDVLHAGGGVYCVPLAAVDPANNHVADQWMIGSRGFIHAMTTAATTTNTILALTDTAGIAAGMIVQGPGLPDPVAAKVLSVDSATQVTLSVAVSVADATELVFTDIPVYGFGLTPPTLGTYRSQFAASDSDPTMGGIAIRVGPNQTGYAQAVLDSSGRTIWGVDPFGYQQRTIFRDTEVPSQVLGMIKNDYSIAYGWKFADNSIRFSCYTNGADIWQADSDGKLTLYNQTRFLAPVRKWAVALSSLPTATAAGAGAEAYVTDSTEPHAGHSGNLVTGGGNNFVPVYSDGTDWRIL